MNILKAKIQVVRAQNIVVTDDSITVDLTDGRTISAPLAWYPRLLHGKPEERNNWRLIGKGEGIHWPDLDEDIGTVVHCYKNGKAFEVEFVTAGGETIALLTLTQEDIRPINHREILHVRALASA